jgi:hypothetical protein
MYYKVILKTPFLTYRYVVLANDPAEARQYTREHHRDYYPNDLIERVTVSSETIDEVI